MNTSEQKTGKRNRKQVLILKGSAREGGNSDILADWLAQGPREVSTQVESLTIHHTYIRPCDACHTCPETGGVYVIQDDMHVLYPFRKNGARHAQENQPNSD